MAAGETERDGIVIESPRPGERLRVIRVPHAEPRRTSRDALALIGVRSGDRYITESLLSALDESEPKAAIERATRLLGHRDRSRHELASRLDQDGYPSAVVESVIARLCDWGYLDDRHFAESYIRTKVSSTWGRRRIKRGLEEAQVEPAIYGPLLDTLVPEESELDRATSLVRPSVDPDRSAIQREMARLVRRGFSYEVARSAVTRSYGLSEHRE